MIKIPSQKNTKKLRDEVEAYLNNIVMQSPVAIMILKGNDYTVELANDFYLQIVEKEKDFIGKPIFESLPELKTQGIKELLDNVMESGIPYYGKEMEVHMFRDEKRQQGFFNFVYQPIREYDNITTGIMVVATEVTEQVLAKKVLEKSEAHFRLMANLMPAKITNADAEGGVTYYNKNWLDYTGMSFEQLQSFGYHKIIHPDDLEEFKKRFHKAAETKTDLEMEMRFLNKGGEYKWHLNLASPVKDENGNIKMWLGVTTEIQKMKNEEERKDNFIKMASHELKTPVTSIKGYIQILLMMLEGGHEIHDPLQVKNSLVRVDKLISKLTRLITEMLDLTRIDESKLLLQKELFNLNELVIETVEDIRYTNTKNPIIINENFTCNVNGDRDRIGQIIINFIGNAIKYSPNNDMIEVRVFREGINKVAVSVQDHGIGINKKDHEKIFERFYRVEGKEEKTFSGFGIGLFIAKSIIERHNGSITIESEKGKGSIFTFILPMAAGN